MSINSRLKATKIIGQGKTFCQHRIPESNCARKETVDILVTSRNGYRKIMQFITIMSRPPSRKRKWNQLSQFCRTSTKEIDKKLDKKQCILTIHCKNAKSNVSCIVNMNNTSK